MASARPAKPRVGPFAPADLTRMAWAPSSRAPRVAAMHDPDLFADRPAPSADLSGRAFLAGHHDGSPAARLVAVQPFVAELARCPHLARLRRLDLSGNRVGPAGVRELAGSPYLDDLNELDMSGNDLGPEGMAALRFAPWFGRLRGLGLADNGLGADDLADLPAGLASLDVSGNTFGPEGPGLGGRGRVLDAPVPTSNRGIEDSAPATQAGCRLDTLRAAGCDLGPEALRLLDVARTVNLRHNRIGPGATWPALLGHLIELDLGFNDLGDAGVGELMRAGGLRSLGLAGNRITAAGVRSLALPGVETIELSANPLGDDVAAAALDGRFPALTRLDLGNVGLTAAGLGELLHTAVRLRSLSLAWNRIGDAGVKALAGCPDLAGLEELDLTGAGIGFAGAVALAESKHLRLRRLLVGENVRLPADAVGMLADRFGTVM